MANYGIDPLTGERYADQGRTRDGERYGDKGGDRNGGPGGADDPARLMQMIRSGQPKMYPKYSKVFGRFILKTHNLPGLFPVSLASPSPTSLLIAASACVRLLVKSNEGFRFVQRASGDIYASTQKIHEIASVSDDLITIEGAEALRVETSTGTVVGKIKAQGNSNWVANKNPSKQEWSTGGVLPYTGMHAACKNAYVWNKMDGSAGILHLETLSEVQLNSFFEEKGSNDFYPLCAIVSPITRNIIGSVIDGSGKHTFLFSDRIKTTRKLQKEIFGTHGHITRMELSLDDRVFFAGGGGSDLTSSALSAKLFCLTFQANPVFLEMIELRSSRGAPVGPISCLKRYPDKQILITGAKNSLWVIEWTGNCFSILSVVEDIHAGFISSVEMLESEQKVFACSPYDSHVTEITYLSN